MEGAMVINILTGEITKTGQIAAELQEWEALVLEYNRLPCETAWIQSQTRLDWIAVYGWTEKSRIRAEEIEHYLNNRWPADYKHLCVACKSQRYLKIAEEGENCELCNHLKNACEA